MRTTFVGVFCLGLAAMAAPNARAGIVDFEDLAHGMIVNTQYGSTLGLTISADNVGGGPDLAVVFDSTIRGSTPDPDLVGPPAPEDWDRGNLAPDTVLGLMLIIAENDRDRDDDGVLDNPDDEGSRPAGSIYFDFDQPVHSFGFDLVDVEGPAEYGRDSGYFAVFYDPQGAQLARVGFSQFVTPGDPFYDPTIEFGNNSANRIQPIGASQFGLASFGRVQINLGGSGAVDNLTFSTPAPTGLVGLLAVLLVGGLFRVWRGRRGA